MAEIGEIQSGTVFSGWSVTFGAAALSGAVGFGFGPAIFGGLAYIWTELLLPTFSLIYIYGVALCT
jgi:hypothetical protein